MFLFSSNFSSLTLHIFFQLEREEIRDKLVDIWTQKSEGADYPVEVTASLEEEADGSPFQVIVGVAKW